MNCAGLILAGGASQRMGSPKALLPYRGETFLNRLIRIFAEQCESVTVVLGYHADAIRASIQHPVNVVVNPEPERGQLSSMQTALAAMTAADRVLYTPVDYPAVWSETVKQLLDTTCESFVIPRYQGKRGHPIVCTWAIVQEFLAITTTARDVVHGHVETTRYLDVDDPGILRDIDDPAAYAELLAAEAR